MNEKKKKHTVRRMGTIPFLLLWITAYIANWGLFMLVPDGYILNSSSHFLNFLAALLVGSILIILIAPMQYYLIRFNYQIDLHGWIWRSIVTSAVALGMHILLAVFTNLYALTLGMSAWLAITGLPALVQWFILRRHINQAWLWICGNFIVGVAIIGLFLNRNNGSSIFLDTVLIGILHGGITGAVMVFLLAQQRPEKLSQSSKHLPDRLTL